MTSASARTSAPQCQSGGHTPTPIPPTQFVQAGEMFYRASVSRVVLVDTNSLFFRAFHGLPPMQTTRGVPTSAVYGFSTLVLKLLREETPKGLAFARDAPAATFRHV